MEHMENDTEKYTTAKCQREVIKLKKKTHNNSSERSNQPGRFCNTKSG
jgi:hypothetical protein